MEHASQHIQPTPTSKTTPATRNTIQRQLVLETVRSLHNHPTSADIYNAVRRQHPTISRATVYRNLNLLAQSGEILRVQLPNGADCYDFRNDEHFHARCKQCGGVFDIEMPRHANLATEVKETHGFAIEAYDVVFTGLCAACQAHGSSA